MDTPLGLHLKIDFKDLNRFKTDIGLLTQRSEKYIWLTDSSDLVKTHVQALNQLITREKLRIISQSEHHLAQGLQVHAYICEDFETIQTLKQNHPGISIGRLASDMAGCKNVELFDGDFVYFGPFETVDLSPYIVLTPEKPDYEWRFIDITIPVISFGQITSNNLLTLTEKANISGFATGPSRFEILNHTTYRFVN